MTNEKALREQLVKLLASEEAHASYEKAVSAMPVELAGMKPDGAPHSAWEELEHLRITQHDILEFIRDPKYVSPKWPEGYWPKVSEPVDSRDWDKSVKAYRADAEALAELVRDEGTDLFAKIPHGDGQTVLREILLVADHTAYHVGQLVLIRKMLGVWG
jgi:hypothetical protein